ncbi:MAG: hypothetical protein KIT31_40715, partial [Deltaproteobacteria bacterium]|nr:hypothetical protein [Deltaproteobacteria bacterium]
MSLLASTLLAAACGSGSGSPPSAGSVQPRGPADPATALARDAVFHDRFARRTLYTWTTTEQIEELRRTGVLLSRSESPTRGTSYAEQVLDALARRGDPTALLLYSTGYAKARHAWPAPWATRAGWPDEQYGDQLIRITLRREAILVSLATATGAFAARDASGGAVSLEEARAHPERIAALYFVSDATSPPAPGVPPPKATYREYVVVNEAMIESWAVGTADVARELETNVDTIEALVRYLRAGGGAPHALAPPRVWG